MTYLVTIKDNCEEHVKNIVDTFPTFCCLQTLRLSVTKKTYDKLIDLKVSTNRQQILLQNFQKIEVIKE